MEQRWKEAEDDERSLVVGGRGGGEKRRRESARMGERWRWRGDGAVLPFLPFLPLDV